MAGALVSHYGSSAVDVISHIVSTQPHNHLAGSADSYPERRNPDPVGKGKGCWSAPLWVAGTWATSWAPQPISSSPNPSWLAITVVGFVNLKLPPHPREGKAVTLI